MQAFETKESQVNQLGLITDEVKITKVEIYKYDIPLIEPFVISLGPIKASTNLLVRLVTDVGLVGCGECSPYVYITGETQESCYVMALKIARLIKGKNPFHLRNILKEIDSAITGNRTVKSAFDMALHDLVGQLLGVPLYALLGGSKDRIIYTDHTIGLGKPQVMAEKASKIKERDFSQIKVKLGTERELDIERIRGIRAAAGDEIAIRIDANQGWDYVTAIKVLKAIEPFNIQFCEAPVPHWNTNDLAKIRQESPIPIMADESLFDHRDAMKLARANAVDFFNIKLAKSGGVSNALKIMHIAEAAGIKCQLGAMGESRLAMTAAAHLGLVSDQISYFDLDSPLMQSEDAVVGGITYHAGGRVEVPDLPGLGAGIDPDFLSRAESTII